MTLSVLGISGSLRRASYNTRLLHIARELAPEHMNIEIGDLLPLPLYNPDIEREGYPPEVAAFRERIRAADALLIACPEYNFSVTSALKSALDWASRPDKDGTPQPLNGKPLGIIGTGGRFGTVRAQLHLRQIAVHLNMLPINKPEVLIPMASQSFTEAGDLKDPIFNTLIRELLVNLAAYTHQIRGGAETPAE